MTAVIHQPYFIPWMGYFSKLLYADKFIVLDNVDFKKRDFIDRVKIINSDGGLKWIGLPIGQQFQTRINEIISDNDKVADLIILNIRSAYSKARYFKETSSTIEEIIFKGIKHNKKLVEINVSIIKDLLDFLSVKQPEIIMSSQVGEYKDKTQRIEEILKFSECKTLVTGNGGSLEAHNFLSLKQNGFSILIQDFYKNHPIYYQTRRTKAGFAKGLSIIDCILNEGKSKTVELLYNKNNIPVEY